MAKVTGNLGSTNVNDKQVIDRNHPPVIRSLELVADQGELPAGLIVAKNAAGAVVPYAVATIALTGTVNGSNADFTASVDAPVAPGSVVITDDEDQTVYDDGHGTLYGDGSGTVNYATGEVSVTFDTAPASASVVQVASARRPVGVLVDTVDTAQDTIGRVVEHGTVVKSELVVSGGGAAADADIKRLEPQIYAL